MSKRRERTTIHDRLSGHFPGAVSLPLDELADRLGEVPTGKEIVDYFPPGCSPSARLSPPIW